MFYSLRAHASRIHKRAINQAIFTSNSFSIVLYITISVCSLSISWCYCPFCNTSTFVSWNTFTFLSITFNSARTAFIYMPCLLMWPKYLFFFFFNFLPSLQHCSNVKNIVNRNKIYGLIWDSIKTINLQCGWSFFFKVLAHGQTRFACLSDMITLYPLACRGPPMDKV